MVIAGGASFPQSLNAARGLPVNVPLCHDRSVNRNKGVISSRVVDLDARRLDATKDAPVQFSRKKLRNQNRTQRTGVS